MSASDPCRLSSVLFANDDVCRDLGGPATAARGARPEVDGAAPRVKGYLAQRSRRNTTGRTA